MRDIGSTKQSKTASAAEDHGLQARYERYREIFRNFTIMSDVFMRNVLKKKACTEYILQVIMEKDLRVVEQELQKDYKNLQGRILMSCRRPMSFLSQGKISSGTDFRPTISEGP